MTNRSKRRQRTAQLLAAAALLSSTVAPYAVQAEETGKTIDTNTNVNSSGGNIDTAMHADGLSNNSITTTSSVANTEAEKVVKKEDAYFKLATTGGLESYFDQWFTSANVVEINGKTYAEVKLEGHSYGIGDFYVNSVTGEKVTVVSSEGTIAAQTLKRVVLVPLDEQNKVTIAFTHNQAETKVTLNFSEALDYTTVGNEEAGVFFKYTSPVSWHVATFVPSIKSASAKKVGDKYEIKLQIDPTDIAALDVVQKDKTIATWSNTSSIITFQVDSLADVALLAKKGSTTYTINFKLGKVDKNVALPIETVSHVDNQFFKLTTADNLASYFDQWFTNADITTINGKLYADVKLEGHSYGIEKFFLNAVADKKEVVVLQTEGTTEDKTLKRLVRVPLDENKKVTFAFNHNEAETKVTLDFTSLADYTTVTDKAQPLTIKYGAAVSWHPAAFVPSLQAASVKKVGKQYEVTLQLDAKSLTYLDVMKGAEKIATWKNTASLLTFTVDSLADVSLVGKKGTSIYTVNFSQAKIDPAAALPVETVDAAVVNLHHTMQVDPATESAAMLSNYLAPYFSNAQLKVIDNKKFVELTLTGHAYAFTTIQYIDANDKKINVETVSSTGEGDKQIRVIRMPLVQDKDGISKIFVNSKERGQYTLFFNFNQAPVTAISDLVATTQPLRAVVNTPAKLTDEQKPLLTALQSALNSATTTIVKEQANSFFNVSIPVAQLGDIKRIVAKEGDTVVGQWPAAAPTTAKSISASIDGEVSNDVAFKFTSLEKATFEVYSDTAAKTPALAVTPSIITSVDNVKSQIIEKTNTTPDTKDTTTTPKTEDTATSHPGGSTGTTPSTSADRAISWDASATVINGGTYGAADGNFIVNYLKPYMTGAKLVTVNGTQYVDLTLTGHATAIQSFSGAQLIDSSNGDKIARFPAAAIVSTVVNAGDYGTYNYTFAFDLGNGLASLPSSSTGSTEAAPTTDAPNTAEETTALTSTGDASFDLTFKPGQNVFKKHITAAQTTLKDGTYTVNVTLNATNGLTQFNVLQNGKQIATWKKAGVTAFLASLFSFRTANTDTVSFEVASLDGLTFEAVTADGTYEAGVKASTKETAPVVKDGPITYTMQADPNGAMPEFITNYLAPYFSNAQYKTIDGKPFVELTLKGKAYGFATLQYTDADNQQQNVEVISSTGEGIDQVRVVRLPLVQDKNGVTKVFVDSGSIGYGAYTLFFKFNVPTAGNPFTDIEGVYSKDEIIALYKAGITTGTTATTYSPSRDMTRAQFAVMIARAFNITSTKETAFADIKGKSYAAQIQGLVETGIVKGVNATTFNPNAPVTRQQAALMMERMLTYKGYTFTADVSKLSFTDKANISNEAKAAFAELQAKGILTGSNGYANPASTLKRAQMAKILKNALDLVHALD